MWHTRPRLCTVALRFSTAKSMSKESRKELAKLPVSEKLKLLAKLRDRNLAIAASRRKKAEAQHEK